MILMMIMIIITILIITIGAGAGGGGRQRAPPRPHCLSHFSIRQAFPRPPMHITNICSWVWHHAVID